MGRKTPPTAEEINIHDSRDEEWAVNKYLGKSLAEVEEWFSDHSRNHSHFEDFYHMGPVAVCYYLPALLDTFQAITEYGYNLFLLHGIIELRLGEDRNSYVEVIPQLREAVEYILGNWKKFENDDFSMDGESLKVKFERLLSDPSKLG